MTKDKWIIVDLDGTCCDISHRMSMLGDWDNFNAACFNDKPYEAIINLVAHLSEHYGVLLLTGRSIKARAETREWLNRHWVVYDELVMRPETDYSSDTECKWREAVRFFGSDEAVLDKVAYVIDDRAGVVAMWRDHGLVCLQPREGDF